MGGERVKDYKKVVYEDDNIIMFEVCEEFPAENLNPMPSFSDIVGSVIETYAPPNKRFLRYICKQLKNSNKDKIEPLLVYYPGNMLIKINEIIDYINNN